jgi:murein L,D-transpeptidase YcbB/YkuD
VQAGDRTKIKLSEAVPVAWVYLDAWASADGVVHYAPDVYNLDDTKDELPARVSSQTP